MRAFPFFFIFLLLPGPSLAQASSEEILPRIRHNLVTIRAPERPQRQGQAYDPYAYFFQTAIPQGKGATVLGTGFVLPDGSHVATTFRALEGSSRFEVASDQGKVYAAQLLGADASLDLAILELKSGKAFGGIDFGDSKLSRIGDPLLMFGKSLRFLMIKTNLAATDTVEGSYGRHWLIDRPTHPGVAGGPLVDTRGRVVGMAVFNAEGPAHLGAALPAALLVKASRELIHQGKLSRAWIGIVPRNLASLDDLDHIHGDDVKGGVLIENLIVDGPAAKAGLQVGDLIMAIGKTTIRSASDLQDFLDKHKAGEKVSVRLSRGSKGVLTLPLALGDLPSAQDLPNAGSLL